MEKRGAAGLLTGGPRLFLLRVRAGYGSRTRLTALGRLGTADIPIPRLASMQHPDCNSRSGAGKPSFVADHPPGALPAGPARTGVRAFDRWGSCLTRHSVCVS